MRLIDPNVLKQQDFQDFSNTDVFYAIDRCPTIEAVPVVRCCECDLWNNWDSTGDKSLGTFACSCAHWSVEDGYTVYTKPNDFCSYGERMDEEKEDGKS